MRNSLSNIYDETTERFIGKKYFKLNELNLVATLVQIEVLVIVVLAFHMQISFKG